MMMMAASLVTVSCDDDDDDVTVDEGTLAENVIGSYSGYTSTTFPYISYAMAYEGETVAITTADDSSVDVTLTSTTWGTYEISGAALSLSNGVYTIAETSGTGSMTGHSGSTSTYDVTMTGTVEDGNVTLTVTIPTLMGGTTIVFRTGDAPAAALIAGSYSGTMGLTVSSIDCGDVTTSVLIVADEDGNATLTLGAFTLEVAAMGSTIELGDIAIEDVTVTDNGDGTYTLTSDSFTTTGVAYGDSSTVTVTGSLSGIMDANGDLSIDFSLVPGSMPFAISAAFTTAAE